MKNNRIVASLKFGKVYPKIYIIVALIGLLSSVMLLPATIYILISQRNPTFLCLVFFVAFSIPTFAFVYVKLLQTKSHIKQTLIDGVELLGKAKGTFCNERCMNQYPINKFLTVEFMYKEKKKTIVSEKPCAKRPFIKHKMFEKYEGKTIKIIY